MRIPRTFLYGTTILIEDTDRHLTINENSSFFSGLTDLALDEAIADYLSRYADFDFDINYEKWIVTFRKGDDDRIKISRGEENLFIWCMFMAICERVIDGHSSYQWVKHLYIDDPISSLDDNKAIAVACDLAALLRKAASRRDASGERDPLTTVFSSHHALFFNVMCNELRRTSRRPRASKRLSGTFYTDRTPRGASRYEPLKSTPYFHHVATLAELRERSQAGNLYTYHFNALRSILEKTASFLGHQDLRVCLDGLQDEVLYNRALNLLSHGKYQIYEPVEMGEDNKELFSRILNDVLERFQFALPELPVRGELKALASLGSRSPRTVNHGRQPAERVLRCAPALRVTAAADRAGSPCGPAGRLALDPLPGSATPASHSVVAENRRQTPEWDRVHLPDRGFAVARTIRKHAVGILAYLDTRMTERVRGRTHPARPTG